MTPSRDLAASLSTILDPILAVPGASDVAINGSPWRTDADDKGNAYPGTVAYCHIGSQWRAVLLAGVYRDDLELLTRVLANRNSTDFRAIARPILDTVLPQGYRANIIGGPHVRYGKTDGSGIAYTIRIDATSPRPTCEPAPFIDQDAETSNVYSRSDEPWLDEAMDLVRAGKGVLFAGKKHSGKTYRLNQLMWRLPLEDRLVMLEDPREGMPPHRNRLCLWYPRTGDTNDVKEADILNAMRRVGEAVVIFGEFTPRLGRFAAEVIETGCVAFLGTFHANTEGDIYRYLYRNVSDNHAFLREHFPRVARCQQVADGFRIEFVDIDDCRAQSGVQGAPHPKTASPVSVDDEAEGELDFAEEPVNAD